MQSMESAKLLDKLDVFSKSLLVGRAYTKELSASLTPIVLSQEQ
jgi:hypothetical protein